MQVIQRIPSGQPQRIQYISPFFPAKRLLSSTELSLTETALSSGFSSAARLGEVFRDELGLTPTAYRRSARE